MSGKKDDEDEGVELMFEVNRLRINSDRERKDEHCNATVLVIPLWTNIKQKNKKKSDREKRWKEKWVDEQRYVLAWPTLFSEGRLAPRPPRLCFVSCFLMSLLDHKADILSSFQQRSTETKDTFFRPCQYFFRAGQTGNIGCRALKEVCHHRLQGIQYQA